MVGTITALTTSNGTRRGSWKRSIAMGSRKATSTTPTRMLSAIDTLRTNQTFARMTAQSIRCALTAVNLTSAVSRPRGGMMATNVATEIARLYRP